MTDKTHTKKAPTPAQKVKMLEAEVERLKQLLNEGQSVIVSVKAKAFDTSMLLDEQRNLVSQVAHLIGYTGKNGEELLGLLQAQLNQS